MAENSDVKTQQNKLPISFGNINEKNVEILRILNQVTFPVQYNPSFYQKVLNYTKYSRLAFFNDIVVGAMTCREEDRNQEKTVYILTIGVLDAYRRYQIGSQMLLELLQLVKQDPEIKSIYLNMQVNNNAGLQFYKKYGFQIVDKLENYYENIQPADCYVLQLKL